MNLGIDARNLISDSRGMGRWSRSIVKRMISRTDVSITFFIKADDSPEKLHAVLGAPENYWPKCLPRHEMSGADMEAFWHPFGGVDLYPSRSFNFVTIHDLTPFRFGYTSLFRYFDQRRDEKPLRSAAKIAQHIFTDAEFGKREIIDVFSKADKEISVVYPGIDEEFLTYTSNIAGKSREKKFAFPYLLYIGVDEARKNLPTLLQGFALWKQQAPNDCRLVLCGVGAKAEKRWSPMLKELRIQNDVVILPFIPDEELKELYRQAEIFVFPSTYEGFGLPVLEAMAIGTPVISSNAASLPEVGGSAVKYFTPDNPNELAQLMENVLTDTALRSELIHNGFIQARKFDWQQTTEQILNTMQTKVHNA